MIRTLPHTAIVLATIPLALPGCQDAGDANASPPFVEQDFRLRSDVEAVMPERAAAFEANPDDDNARRAYASILHKLGNVWEAAEVIAPLGDASSVQPFDLELAGELAYLTGDYDRAETLHRRLLEISEPDTEDHDRARRGLTLAWYQSDRFASARELPPPAEDDEGGHLLSFMQAFEGEPYQLDWSSDERVAHLPMTNDITQPGALPIVEIEVNGQTLSLILDTGGDLLFIDRDLYETLGFTTLAEREARYAYTGGQTVTEPLGVAQTVALGGVTLGNVPVVGATWKALGQTSDGVFTTQILKRFLSTMDYDNRRIVLRERTPEALAQVMNAFGEEPPVTLPFFMATTHLMFAKGSLNGREINYFLDSGLAMSMPMIVVDETVELLGLETNAIEGTDYFWTNIESHGLNGLVRGATQAMGNVFVENNPFWQTGFMMDALMSHQYLWQLGSWTIDFDNMNYHFPAQQEEEGG